MMGIDIELYKIFYIVAKNKSITKAAENLYISQPAVTMSIKKLEEQLEMTLFVRTKRGVILTSEGKVLYEYVSKAMESIKIGENRISNLKKLDTGNIKIGIGTTLTKYFLKDYLEKFHKLYPNVTINIDTSMTSELLKSLENGKVDLAIIPTDKLEYKGFNIEYSREIQDIFVANKEYFDSIGKKVHIADLNNYPLLLQNQNASTREFLDRFACSNGIKLKSSMELASYSLILEFAKIGLGIGFISRDYAKKEIEEKELFEIQTIPQIPKRKILVLTKKDYLPSFSTSKLLDIIKNN